DGPAGIPFVQDCENLLFRKSTPSHTSSWEMRRESQSRLDQFSGGTSAGITARRIEWSGSNEPSPERPRKQPPTMMRGIMIVGINGDLGLVLHVQDVEPAAISTVPVAEQALQTFTITKPK
ncbi:MAG TPA: hypothetical protein VJM31_19465, partial [Vicinamibacterales bacterium]|nr:hypothetical protein [Vicinamibacterales bacterium]